MGNHNHEYRTDFPPLITVSAALLEITETLARELGAPTNRSPAWDHFEWRIARAVAAMQGVSSLLSGHLRWNGPESWRRFLQEQRDHIAGRHRKITRLLNRIDSGARREGVPLVALKGAELHRRGIYEVGERPMADVDLLVSNANLSATIRVLKGCGYELTFTTWRHHLFESSLKGLPSVVDLGEHVDNPIKIELHTSIRERLPVSETDITRLVFASAAHAGLNGYPSMIALMIHLLLHAAGNMRAHALRLIQLHDIARLATRLGPSDWAELMRARLEERGLWWAVAPLMLTERYYPATVPPYVIACLSEECPWLLRRTSRRQCIGEVSWSNLQVYAFPGIEWSRTPLEALRFIISRIWPSREARSELQRFAARHPGAAGVPWYGISQGGRILRWAFSKPPRVQALLPVRAALAQTHDEAARGTPAES
jgi:putative nucleotidyltransferase-like protein